VTEQLTLTYPKARLTDPATSHQAAALNARVAEGHRARAERALHAAGPAGLTDFGLADATGLAQTSVGKRRLELLRAGLVCPLFDADGKQVTRLAPSGARSLVWVHVDHVGQVAA
jgi:hypothetical protein